MTTLFDIVGDALHRLDRKVQGIRDRRTAPAPNPDRILSRAYDTAWADHPCVFVLSTGRTGTETLTKLLALSPGVHAEHEAVPQLVKASFDAYMETGSTDWAPTWQRVALAARDDLVLNATRAGKVYFESNYRLTYLAPALAAAFPASRFLFLHRDPYAVVRSGMRRGYYRHPFEAWNFARIRPRPSAPDHGRWDRFSQLEKNAWRWAHTNAFAADVFEQLPASRRFELPSADLFGGGRAVQERLFSFCGVDCPPARETASVVDRKFNAQDHYHGDQFEWTDDTRALVRPLIEHVADRLGYPI
jgi:hypothetical protein